MGILYNITDSHFTVHPFCLQFGLLPLVCTVFPVKRALKEACTEENHCCTDLDSSKAC